jgi:transposase-like protein
MPAAKPKGFKLTLDYVAKHLSDEATAYGFIEGLRWPNGPVCPHCESTKAYFLQPRDGSDTRATRTGSATQRRVWKCAACRKQFSVLVGTIFEGSKIPLGKWLLAIYMMCSGKNGVAAHELHRDLEITYKSAWFMAHRIRYAMSRPPLVGKLSGIIEADETYFGGKPRYKAPNRQEAARRREAKKIPVVSLVERGGEVRSQVMQRVDGSNIREMLAEHIDPSSRLMTDESRLYPQAGKMFASHETVNHREAEYARGDVTTNHVEGYFSQLKRSIDGTHHHVSARHLHRYVSEFDLRFNTRGIEDGPRMTQVIRQAEGKRMMYRGRNDQGEG